MASVLAVLASYGVAGPGAASAASIAGSGFEIDSDANLTVQGSGGAIDWLAGGSGSAMRDGVLVRDDQPTGQNDDSFTQGTSEDDPLTTITTGSIPNHKSDLTHFGVYVERSSSATFVNVFWTRVQDPTGTTNMDFEFNQSAVRLNGVATNSGLSTQTIPVRTPGDILITYDLSQGGTHPVLSRRTWSATGWGPATVFDDTQALGSINASPIASGASGGLGALDARTFGEASINLAALVPSSSSCTTYGSAYVKSRASDSFTAEMKDFIAPEPVTISNCGSVTVHKTDAHGALRGAGFTLYKDVAPLGGTAAGTEDTVAANVAGTCTTDAGGDCTISNVRKGDYWLVETTVPAGHDPAADQHVSITAGDQVVAFTLDDPIQHGTITVTKVAVPPDGTPFSFSLDGSSFSLQDPASATVPSTRSFTVEVGTHTLTETNIPSSWTNTHLVCTDPTSDTTVALPSATVRVAKDETVACTYTDAYNPSAPGLTTDASESAANTSWNDTATLTGDGTHAVTGTVAFFACDPASTATPCTSGGTKVGVDVPVTHTSGSTYTAVTSVPFAPSAAGWSCFRAEYTSTSPYYSDTTHTNATSECFLKHNANLTVSKTAVPAFGRVYHWTIAKSVDQARVNAPSGTDVPFQYTLTVGNTHEDGTWTVSGTITVSNPNPVAFTGVDVTDAIDNGAGSCTVTGGTGITVPANGSQQLSYLCSYGTTAPTSSTGHNTATATWDSTAFFTTAGSATGTATADFSSVQPSNTDESVTITDTSQQQSFTVDALTDANPATIRYTASWPAVASTCTTYPNTATLVANDSKAEATASQSVEVCGGSPLGVTQTAAGSFERDYGWTLGKAGTPTLITNPNGSTGTFAYSVTVTPAGTLDKSFVLGGTVTVTNPNNWEDVVADVTVADDLGFTCTVPGGAQVTVLRGTTQSFDYTCTPGSAPTSSGTVTASATWDSLLAATSAAGADAPQAVTLSRTDVNRTVTVVDDKTVPGSPVELGTWTYDQGAHTFTYDLTQPGVDNVCTDYPNVATIVETSQSATATVTLCHTFTGGGGGPVITPTPAPHITGGGGLPFTGAALGLLTRTALALLAGGLVLLLVSRKRRSA